MRSLTTQKNSSSAATSQQVKILQRQCLSCVQHNIAGERNAVNQAELAIVGEVLKSPGQPLDDRSRNLMESRFNHDFSRVKTNTINRSKDASGITISQEGDSYEQEAEQVADIVTRSPSSETQENSANSKKYDFSQVRVHNNTRDAESTLAVKALAYTVGRDVVFGNGQYAPQTLSGQKLLAHELAHVVQQGAAPKVDQPASVEEKPNYLLQRQTGAGGAGVTGAAACGVPSGCPPEFCTPYFSTAVASGVRTSMAPVLLAGIAAKVSSRVVPLWSQYLFGGSAPQNLSSQFGRDFTTSATTAATTDFLINALKTNLESSPPTFPPGNNQVTVDIPSRIGTEIGEIGNPTSANVMDFNAIGEIPGNIAGGIGKTQLSCPVGAMPSPFDDDRTAVGTAQVTLLPNNSLAVIPSITYTVKDTIDLCPGNCGASIEQIATVSMSRMEASGISGDVPFTVEFSAPFRSFITRPITPTPPPPPTPPTPPSPVTGEITASVLRIRQAPNTLSSVLGNYPQGATIAILCQTTGENVAGNNIWDRTDRGFISDKYVHRTGTDTPASC
jgi:Domain of unknown function (DUF4157)